MEKKKEKSEGIVLPNKNFDEEKFRKQLEEGRKEYEERREIAFAKSIREQYDRWQKLRAEHPFNTLDFW